MKWLIPAGAAALLLAAFFGWWMHRDVSARPEVVAAAPAERQGDGSLLAGRKPAAKPTPAPHALPRGAKEERRIAVTVKPQKADCPPLRLDLSLVQVDGGRRVIASSPDGTIVDAVDIPIEAALIPPPARPWAAGVSWAPREELGGAWIERDIGRVRLGADIEEAGNGELMARVRLGWRF